MLSQAYSIRNSDFLSPLVLGSPHSGRIYPRDFRFTCSLKELRRTEDAFVDELIEGGVEAGAAIIQAEFPRSYIDPNRAEDDIDPALLEDSWPLQLNPSPRTLMGFGLVRRLCRNGAPVYLYPLPVAEVKRRIEEYYRPYHYALEKLLAERQRVFGQAFLIDCHSMPKLQGSNSPDFVIGDLDGKSCDSSFTSMVKDILESMGYEVSINDPYKGVEILRRHGLPHKGIQALQLEVSRHLYLDEITFEKTRGFSGLKKDLKRLFEEVAYQINLTRLYKVAAE